MISISNEDIRDLEYTKLIELLKKTFAGSLEVPQRQHYNYNNPGHQDGTLLMMPAWNEKHLGVKLIMISPDNSKYDLPSINGTYNLYRISDGTPVATVDAKALTTKRTAATSALASSFLSNEDAENFLMVGTGALAPELIRAHCSIRNYKNITIWGRNSEKAQKIRNLLSDELEVQVAKDLGRAVRDADVISVATLTVEPLIKGLSLKDGCHLDLVGAYRHDMRETDNAALLRAKIFVDTYEGAVSESGELKIPLNAGTITENDLVAELNELCTDQHPGRTAHDDITIFKSSGHAIEDLVTAELLYEQKSKV